MREAAVAAEVARERPCLLTVRADAAAFAVATRALTAAHPLGKRDR